jgi:hypothetical protein
MLHLTNHDGVENKVPGSRNNCLLEALVYDGAPKGRRRKKRDAAAANKALREELAAFAREKRTLAINGTPLDAWAKLTSGVDIDTWADRFAATDLMSDQIVLCLWPHVKHETVWVWQPCAGGFEHRSAYCFASSAAADCSCRHVVYRPDELHYNALQVVRPEKLRGLSNPIENIAEVRRSSVQL